MSDSVRTTTQAAPSLGFSRQEHWSGLPFPPPMHESEVKGKSLGQVQLLATPGTAAHQAPPSVGFSRQEHWSGLPFPPPMHESEVKGKSLGQVRLLATPGTAAHQAPPSVGFSRQEHWSGVPLPSPSFLLPPTQFACLLASKNILLRSPG